MGRKIIFGQHGFDTTGSTNSYISKISDNNNTYYIRISILVDIDDIQSCKYENHRYELVIKDDGKYEWYVGSNPLTSFEQQFPFFPYEASSQPTEIILRLQKLEKENAMLLSHIETLMVTAGLRPFDADPIDK
jgi:hypothetical protein